MHRAQGATGNCAIAFFLPALFYLGWAERFPRSLGPFVKGQSEAGWLRQCAKFIFLLGLFNSGSGIWGGTSILLAGHAPPPPPTPHELLTASIREELEGKPLSVVIERLEAEGVSHAAVSAVLDARNKKAAALPLLVSTAEQRAEAAAEAEAAQEVADAAHAAAEAEAERLVEAERKAARLKEEAKAAERTAAAAEEKLYVSATPYSTHTQDPSVYAAQDC